MSIVALAVLVAMTAMAFTGPNRLPDRVPIHFDMSGQANGWGSPLVLLALPIGGIVLYAVMTIVVRWPQSFNFPVRSTPENRPRLEALTIQMISWLKAETACLFLWIQHFTIAAARSGQGALPAAFLPVTLGGFLGTILVFFVLIRRAAG